MSSSTSTIMKVPKVDNGSNAKNATKYSSTCAALKVKPNSRILAREEQLGYEHVDLSNNYIGGGGFQAVTQILAENEKMETLNASDNGLNNEAIVFFCRAVATHPALKTVDFSKNPLSLPAGLALLDLVHKNKRIAEIKLEETHIDEPVLRRIKRALNLNRIHTNQAANPTLTPFEKVKAGYQEKAEARKGKLALAKVELEAQGPAKIAEWVKANNIAGPPRGNKGWVIVNLCISCTPTDFVSELALIHDVVCPKLNDMFAKRRVYFVPLSMYNDLPPHHHRGLEPSQRLAIRPDYISNIAKSVPFFIQLLGDRVGLAEYSPTTNGTAANAAEFPSILQKEYEMAGEACSIIMVRRPALQLNVPTPLVPLVSSNPQLSCPDANTYIVKAAVAEAQGRTHPMAGFDINVENRKWESHMSFKNKVMASHPPEFVVSTSNAEFDEVSPAGHLVLKNLEGFTDSLLKRVSAAVDVMYPKQETYESETEHIHNATYLGACTDRVIGKKNLLGKLDLYAVTPPSRNMTLVYGPPGSGLSSCMGAFVHRCLRKNSYTLAYHFTHQSTLSSEPTDPRTMFLSLAGQLLPDGKVPSYIRNEVDVIKVKEYFMETLAKTASELSDGKALVVVVDGIDDVDAPIVPCQSLRISETGAEMWAPAPPVSTVNNNPVKPPTPKQDGYDYIPVCLARNVRWVASCQAFSTTHRRLEARGHDSCEPVTIGEIGDNDVEVIVSAALATYGISLTEDELGLVRSKDDCHLHDYIRFVVDRIKHQEEVPGNYITRQTLIEQMPQSLSDMCRERLLALEAEFGAPLISATCGILLTSRWGVTELELRELLAKSSPTRISTKKPLLCGETFNRLLRRLAPVLQPYLTEKSETNPTQTAPMNAMDMIVKIQCRTFRAEAMERYFAATADGDDTEKAAAEDRLQAVHHQLAHHYYRLATSSNHPLEAKGVKEFPYHVIMGRMWSMLEENVVCLAFVSQAYLHELGYQAARELIRAYNTVEAAPATEIPNKKALLLKISEYVYFVRDHNINMSQYPHMVRQIAVTCSAETHLHQDAKEYFKDKESLSHFLVMNKTKAKLHRDAITGCQFAPDGHTFVTCSDDRSMKICNIRGQTLKYMNQSTSKLKLVRYSPTSRYIVLVTEDRTTYVIDAHDGELEEERAHKERLEREKAARTKAIERGERVPVEVRSEPVDKDDFRGAVYAMKFVRKFHGHTSTIKAVTMSARGRFVATGSEDRTMKLWESETGVLLCTVSHSGFSHHTSAYGGVNVIAAHPYEEDKFFTVCDKKVLGWKLANSREQCDEFFCINAHNSLPINNIHIVADGGFIIATARDLADTPAKYTRAEDNIKVFSIHTGRCVATLSNGMNMGGSGPVMSAVSMNEKIVASALYDGTLQLHELACRSYAPEAEEPISVAPFRHFTAFRGHPVARISHLAFSHDSKFICAAGNQRQLKVWTTNHPTEEELQKLAAKDSNDEDVKTPSNNSTVSPNDTAVNVPVLAEFLMEQQCVTMDWTSLPTGDIKGGELIVGDVVGRLHALRLKQS